MRVLIFVLLLTGCASKGPTSAEQTAFIASQIESTLIRMECESKCKMQMPLPGSQIATLQQPTNINDLGIATVRGIVGIVPWLATWGIVDRGYDAMEGIIKSFPSGASNVTTNNTTTTSSIGDTTTSTTGDTSSSIGDSNSGNSTSSSVATSGDTVTDSNNDSSSSIEYNNANNTTNADNNSNQNNTP